MKSILDPKEHARLIADMEHIASVAGVQEKYIHQSMVEVCSEPEIEWVRNYNKHKSESLPGLVLHGTEQPDAHCQAIAGALLRNYLDARVIPLNTLLDSKEIPNPTVLLIPNLFVKVAEKGIPSWRMQSMYDILLDRVVHNKQSVLYIQDRDEMKKVYGMPFLELLLQFRWVN